MQKEFINVAAHELRTPIQPILGLAEVLKSRIKDKDQSESLDVLIRNAKRLQRLSQDILDVTMIESRMLKLNKEKLDLNELIANTVKEQIQQLQRSNSKVKLLFEQKEKGHNGEREKGNRIFVEADRERIGQVICNLISNAIKFTKDGTISIGTTVKESENGKPGFNVIVRVKDTGQGIAPEIKRRLFSKFATRSFQGTGLGLYISKSIIEAHGGRIWVEDNTDGPQGATFCFTLPIID